MKNKVREKLFEKSMIQNEKKIKKKDKEMELIKDEIKEKQSTIESARDLIIGEAKMQKYNELRRKEAKFSSRFDILTKNLEIYLSICVSIIMKLFLRKLLIQLLRILLFMNS